LPLHFGEPRLGILDFSSDQIPLLLGELEGLLVLHDELRGEQILA
jgi:hypothetical protein